MLNYPVGLNPYMPMQASQMMPAQMPAPMPQTQVQQPMGGYSQVQTMPAAPNNGANGAVFNIAPPAPGSQQGANGVTINIMGASVNPNGANINNTYNNMAPQAPAQSTVQQIPTYPPIWYMPPQVPVGATGLNQTPQTETDNKPKPKKDIVVLTDEYIKTLENYLRNDNPDVKVMGAKALMERFREDESRKNDQALINLLNLALQSKYSQVKMIATSIIENGWTRGDAMTQQLLNNIQQSKSGYGLDALDAANAALKAAGETVKVDDLNPEYSKKKIKSKSDK